MTEAERIAKKIASKMGTGRRLTPAESKEKTKDWPKLNKKSHNAAQKADPHWEMADRPHLTKGHQIYEKNK